MTPANRPNILLITTDQQRWDTIHAHGNPAIFTPHLNWIADTGISFCRAYSDCPVCMPARASIMTGLSAYRHGALANEHSEPIRGRDTLPALLASLGYETRAQGKMHFHPMRKKYGFEAMELSHDYYRTRQKAAPHACGAQHGQGQNEMEPVLGSVDENHTLTRWVVDRSIDFLETRDTERPFFLWTSISKPHPPFDPSANFWELYRDLTPPAPWQGDWAQAAEASHAGFFQPTFHLNNAGRFSPEQLRQIRRAYYACITEVDANLGRLFSHLRENGLLRDTWILFTSDHGEMLGDHGMGGKGVFLEGSAHVPLLLRPPGEWDREPSRGTSCDSIACLRDVLPTCLDIAGAPELLPSAADGLSLLVQSRGETLRSRLFGQCQHQFMTLDSHWKYTCSTDGSHELLFDLADDPRELVDLSTTRPDLCRQLRSALEAELSAAGSPEIEHTRLRLHPPMSLPDIRRWTAWPGFHATHSVTDLLH